MDIRNKKAFTLIELIVVIAVIGILVLLAMPKFLGYVEKSQITVIRHDVKVTEDKMTEMLMHGDELFKNENGDSDWDEDYVDPDHLIELIREGELYETRGVVNEEIIDLDENDVDYVDLSEFKIVPHSIRINVGTKLTGDFYANSGGKVYYEREKGTAVAGNTPGNLMCKSEWIVQDNHPLLSALMPVLGYDGDLFEIKSYKYKDVNYMYTRELSRPGNEAGLNTDIFLSMFAELDSSDMEDPTFQDGVYEAFQASFVYNVGGPEVGTQITTLPRFSCIGGDIGDVDPVDPEGLAVAAILERSESGYFYDNSLKNAAVKLGVPNSSSYDNFDLTLLEAYRRGVSWWEDDYVDRELMLAKIDNKFILIQVDKSWNNEEEQELYGGAQYKYRYDDWNVIEIVDAKMVSDKNINWDTFNWNSVDWQHLDGQRVSAPQHAKIVYVVGFFNHFERINLIEIPEIPKEAWDSFIAEYKLIENEVDMFPLANSY